MVTSKAIIEEVSVNQRAIERKILKKKYLLETKNWNSCGRKIIIAEMAMNLPCSKRNRCLDDQMETMGIAQDIEITTGLYWYRISQNRDMEST